MNYDTQNEFAFLNFALETGVLRFGEFTLKSGRVSPYFFNAGLFNSGKTLGRLADFYADALNHREHNPFMLFGPAYKGIPLAAATAASLFHRHDRDVPYAFNRKEVKDHGEGGQLVGAPLSGDIVIIDDVITAGTSARESVDLIQQSGANPVAVMIALDREEVVNDTGESAIQSVTREFGLRVHALARFQTLLAFLESHPTLSDFLPALEAYRRDYGSSE
ncbi:MAG: orotate phosphoribosyltransferase [Gammaproteobacteria bacterium]|nr:orotate phosphoribosyltransferase [Gammaproteobacteria bacterium]